MTDIIKLEEYYDRLWPICRSITGNGYRDSLKILSEIVPFNYLTFESGQSVNDWIVPDEWHVNDAYIIDPKGRRRAWFKNNNLHLVNYSIPFQGILDLNELKKHLYYIKEQPNAIPYITSYYKKRWGICLSYDEYASLPPGDYKVIIDTEIKPGKLVIAEALLKGASEKEILLSSYLCHPSMANNELSGPLALCFLFEKLSQKKNRHFTYRFVISAETIGTISYLSQRGEHLKNNLLAGYQMTCLADRGKFTFKKSRRDNSIAERAALKFFKETNTAFNLEDFDPGNGSDERQYCSPGYNLPVASLMRTMYSRFPEYHTSLDNKDFISFNALKNSIETYENILENIETAEIYKNLSPNGEPNLGKRNLYPTLGLTHEVDQKTKALLWLLNYSDGNHELEYISTKSNLPLSLLRQVCSELVEKNLLEKI